MDTNKIYAESIINEYSKKKTSNVVALKKLDARVKRPATLVAYILGILATLLFGVGMCLSMKVIGNTDMASFIIGIICGIIGILGVSINYPIYKKKLEKNKEKYAQDIINLATEIIEEN